MSGGGLYSLATCGAKDVIDIATPRVLAAIDDMDIVDNCNRFVMADIGCADGGTSLDMVRRVIAQVRQRAPAVKMTVIYADQTANDFNALINIVHGRTRFESWFEQFDNVYPLVSGSSFYLQTVPDGTLDLVFSATAMHWLSKKPCNISNHVHMVGASGKQYEIFARQAKQDWQTILMCRAHELKCGGKMVLVNFCRDQQGRYLGNTDGVNMFDTLNEIWGEFLGDGRITQAEYQNMTLPQYYHTLAEFAEPLTNPDNPCYRAGLRLNTIETGIIACPFAQQFKVDNEATTFDNGLIGTIRSWNQSVFLAALNQNRPQAQRSQLIEDYYKCYHQRVLDHPDGHGMDYVHAYMTITRV